MNITLGTTPFAQKKPVMYTRFQKSDENIQRITIIPNNAKIIPIIIKMNFITQSGTFPSMFDTISNIIHSTKELV